MTADEFWHPEGPLVPRAVTVGVPVGGDRPTKQPLEVDVLGFREGESHKEWLHRNGYMTHDEAVWYHRCVGLLKWVVVVAFVIALLRFLDRLF